MRALMAPGVSGSAGKSLLVTALARHFARADVDVAPFGAQDMSNHARVVAGGETGTVEEAPPDGLGWATGRLLAVYLHGLLEDPAVPARLGGTGPVRSLDQTFDDLADAVERHLDLDRVHAWLDLRAARR